jgi:hypothetical protein
VGVAGRDDPTFVKRLFVWVRRHPRAKMLVYYQDFGAVNSFRIQNFPAYAFEPPRPLPVTGAAQ